MTTKKLEFDATKIKSARINAGITQKEMAHNMGCSQRYYSKLEKGDSLDIDNFTKILNLLGYNSYDKLELFFKPSKNSQK